MTTRYERLTDYSVESINRFGAGRLPGHLGIDITAVSPERVSCRTPIQDHLLAPNGYLHAGSVVTIADTAVGYGCIVNLPDGATGFTTIELKSNFLGTTRSGAVLCEATPVHRGTSTQVWDAVVTDKATGKTIALFRCTQMILWPR